MPSSISAEPITRPTTGSWPGAPTPRVPNTSRSASATSRPAPICRTRSRAPPAASSGSANSTSFYYVELDENHRPVRVKRHRLGTTRRQDAARLRGEGSGLLRPARQDPVGRLRAHRGERPRNLRSLAARPRRPPAAPRLVEPRTPQLQYDVEHHGDDLIILTNADGAEDFKIVDGARRRPGPRALARSGALPRRA